MRPVIPLIVLVGLFSTAPAKAATPETTGAPRDATATEVVSAPVVPPAPTPFKAVADAGIGVYGDGPSLHVFVGLQYDPIRIGAWLDGGMTWYDWTNFHGVGIGPVFELPLDLRASIIAGVGWQTYTIEKCSDACNAARVTESRMGYAGRVGLGRTFPLRRNGTSIVVMGWFIANYSEERRAALTASDIMYSNRPDAAGGFRPGGLITVGLDFAL
jgi:hypothetical protein